MHSKPLFLKRAFTLVELLVVIAILAVLTGIVVVAINPQKQLAKSRDTRRIADVGVLVTAIQEYNFKEGSYPDYLDVTRVSNIVVPGGNLYSAASSWIFTDMSDYLPKMVVDPINTGDFIYRYRHNSIDFEVDAKFEIFTDKQMTDGGNNNNRYELGSDLTILD